MSAINDGGPAFAALATSAIDDVHHQPGMSLRDWFAGHMAAAAFVNATGIDDNTADDAFPLVARLAYRFADAMLAARQKDGQP